MALEEQIAELRKAADAYIPYIYQKITERDFHAVSDACMDIREIEAKIDVLIGQAMELRKLPEWDRSAALNPNY